jgi:putative transcriptional regulator
VPASLAGQVLLAHPSLDDANFRRTAVLLHHHSAKHGALGVILNRPLARTLADLDGRFAPGPLAEVPALEGGPVHPDRLALGSWRLGPAGLVDLRFGLDEAAAARLAAEPDVRLRAYVGHAAWSPGQLDNELRLNAWVVAPLAPDVEALAGEELWRRWLGRLRPDLRLAADAPGDPGLN